MSVGTSTASSLSGALLALLAALFIGGSQVAVATPTGELPEVVLFSFTGVVEDSLERPIIGATVQDGSKSTITGAQGQYELPQSRYGSFSITVSRPDIVTQTKTALVQVPTDPTRVDFTVWYALSGSLSSTALSTASSPANATLTVNSFAPFPGAPGGPPETSCVSVTDSRTGSTTAAVHEGSNGDGSSRWTWGLAVPQGTAAGQHSVTFRAADCATAVALTLPQTVPYVIDNSSPSLAPSDLLPLEGMNSLAFAGGQPLAAHIVDVGAAGLNVGSVRFTLYDDTLGSSSLLTGAVISYDATSGWARTADVELTPGHRYHMAVEAADNAGNLVSLSQAPASQGGGFLAVSESFGPSTASISATPCAVSETVDPVTATRAVTCQDVPIVLPEATVTLSGSLHPGVGTRHETISLDSSVLTTTVGGVPITQPARPSGDPSWASWAEPRGFDVPSATDTSASYPVGGRTIYRSELVTRVPAAWTSATISMPPVSTAPRTPACGDPVATRDCYPDPVAPQLPAPGAADPAWLLQLKSLAPADPPEPEAPVAGAATSTTPVASDSWYVVRETYEQACLEWSCANNPITQHGFNAPRGSIASILSFGAVCGPDSISVFGPQPDPCVGAKDLTDVGLRASWFWWGYWQNSAHDGSGWVRMAIGTSNNIIASDGTMRQHGANLYRHAVVTSDTFANNVCSLPNLFFRRGFYCYPTAGNDIETPWSSFAPVEAWLDGWQAEKNKDYGTPHWTGDVFIYGWMSSACNAAWCWDEVSDHNGWTPHQIAGVFVDGCAYDFDDLGCDYVGNHPFVQIYKPSDATYWADLKAAVRAKYPNSYETFALNWGQSGGVLDACEVPDGANPAAAYSSFVSAVDGVKPAFLSLQYSLAASSCNS